ncbi:MAG: tRNA-dihydrouridine synthase family protein [Lachnospiraceae bacterium]|nr:tRNA-dihydrouridine synthase family protein [Lachnospiraceae bacterium]
MAPMEGVTTRTYRTVFRKYFGGVDKYFTPFLVANQTHHFKKREIAEVTPMEDELVPQILTCNGSDFLWAAKYLAAAGYREVNLNLGCPYPTVFTKGKGSGMLADPDRLERFLAEIFSAQDIPEISIKTRVGVKDPDEATKLAEIFACYPVKEIIIHPRVREDYYQGKLRLEAFRMMLQTLSCPVCFNGDICEAADWQKIGNTFPAIDTIMIGRGLIADPMLAITLKREAPGYHADEAENVKRLKSFLDELWYAYSDVLYGERDVLFKMKEIWYYMGRRYHDRERALLDIKKARYKDEYADAVSRVFDI